MRQLRIGICGAPRTGKSKLAKAVSEEFTLPLICQGAQELRALTGSSKMRMPLPKMNEAQRMEWQLAMIEYRTQRESEMAEFVADGTALDLTGWYRMCSWLISFDHKVKTEDLLYRMASRYSMIFYCPLWIDDLASAPQQEDDPFWVDPFNLETYDYILKGIVSTMAHKGYRCYVLQKRTHEGRLEEIVDVVKPMLESGVAIQ